MKPRRTRYSAAETQKILELAGDMPWPLLPSFYNRWAGQHGFPRRSRGSLRQRVEKLGASLTAMGGWLTAGGVATTLDIHPCIPAKWAAKWPEILKPYQPAPAPGARRRGRIYMRRDALRALARQHPEQFAGIPADRLLLLLERPALVEQITTEHPIRRLTHRPVRCIETGQTYPSRTAAGRALFLHPETVGAAARGLRPAAAGLHFVEVGA